ncbi:hypothetical protein [Curtobacterium sp. L1-20]|uniref:hypothetical protein n=1 Tax=Curtobacterium sp. L1-20 TaxID=3138181 RepID=UPI003B529F91
MSDSGDAPVSSDRGGAGARDDASGPAVTEGAKINESRPIIDGSITEDPRDRVRRTLAIFLVCILAGTILAGLLIFAFRKALQLDTEDVRAVVEVFFPSIVTLVGTVMGFYFGTEHRND